MTAPSLCANCGCATVSVDPGVHLDDLDKVLIRNHNLIQSIARTFKKVKGILAGTGILVVIILFVVAGFFKALLISTIATLALLGGFYLFVQWANARLRSSSSDAYTRLTHRHDEAARLEVTLKDIVYPFLDRNEIAPFDKPVVPQDELVLLDRALASRSFPIRIENLDAFLASAALDRDYQRFAAQAERMTKECGNVIAGFASLYPDTGYDGRLLPFLQQYLATLGKDWSPGAILPKLAQHREAYRQCSFERDLALRKSGAGQKIRIEDIDRMDPFNFELLLGMIFEAQGYRFEETPKSGDQGADVLLEKAGERTVAQAKLYSQPVGNGAVQEAIAAKTYFRCHVAMVVTNNTFTASARDLAVRASVQLVDRIGLISMIDAFNRSPKDYHRLGILMRPRDDAGECGVRATMIEEARV